MTAPVTQERAIAGQGNAAPAGGKRGRRARMRERLDTLGLLRVLIWAFFTIFLLVPLLSLVVVSLTGQPANLLGSVVDGTLRATNLERLADASLGTFADTVTRPAYVSALGNSLTLATWVALITTLMAMPIAYGIARTAMPFKRTLSVLCTVPIVIPTMVGAGGLIIMFGRSGWASELYRRLGGDGVIFNVNSMTGIVLAMVFFLFPFVLWPMVAAFRVADVSVENAAMNLGARRLTPFFTATLPLALPGVISSALLIFAIAFSDFGAAIVLAPPDLNLIVVQAYREIAGFFNWAGASVLVIVMTAVVAAFFGLQRLVLRGKGYGTLTGRGTTIELNRSTGLCRGLAVYTTVVVLLPTLVLLSVVVMSFSRRWSSSLAPQQWTLAHYERVFGRGFDNVINSLILGFGALLLCLVLGTFITYFVHRHKSTGLDFLTTIPLIVPGIALGIALIQSFNAGPFVLTGGAFLLVVGYAIRRLPYMLRSTAGSMQAIGTEVEEAAGSLGASRFTAVSTVVFPLLAPGLLAGSILVFVTVIKETSLTVLMAPAGWQPMSYRIFEALHRGEIFTASALSVLLVVIVVVLQQVAYRLTGGMGRR
ncbi:ABC transporter permease [Phytoactinopolyspora limicola]|uniref:ABC transporter permease n=1 Tax=Phytoactinopolyspora limicola TaxID=2715536 RepID=UPI001A9C5BB5|nr:iron ABC transporter permease [Phytoactinopolyspora limicola]